MFLGFLRDFVDLWFKSKIFRAGRFAISMDVQGKRMKISKKPKNLDPKSNQVEHSLEGFQ